MAGARRGELRCSTERSDPWRERHDQLLRDCGLHSEQAWNDYVDTVRTTRARADRPLTRWSAAHLLTALDLAVRGRGWPVKHAATALLSVAADPATRSPARLAEAGPWWDETPGVSPGHEPQATAPNLTDIEAELDATNGKRVLLQRQARQQLARAGQPVTRCTVLQTAVNLLHSES